MSKGRFGRRFWEGPGLALLMLGGLAAVGGLIAGAILSPPPFNGLCIAGLGLGVIAANRPCAEVWAHWAYADALVTERQRRERTQQPHWYAWRRLTVVAIGVAAVVFGMTEFASAASA